MDFKDVITTLIVFVSSFVIVIAIQVAIAEWRGMR